MKSLRAAFLAMALLLTGLAPALAAELKTFTVLPFMVNGPTGYKYLEQSIPQMFTSRLFWKGQFEPAGQGSTAKAVPVADEAAAEKARAALNADYVLWGSVTIVGENCSVDLRVKDRQGKVWPRSRETTVNQLIPTLKSLSDAVSADVFQRPREVSQAQAQAQASSERTNQMNPELVHNQTTPKEVYMNPQFRYSGARGDDSRQRSQTLQYPAVGMEVCDADGDGKNEVFILANHQVNAYRYEEDRLTLISEFKLPLGQQTLTIRSLDFDKTGRPKLIVTAIDTDEAPVSRIFSFNGRELVEEAKTSRFFLNVASFPPDFRPVLVGQAPQPPKIFRPGVFEVELRGNTLTQGRTINLPKDVNVFNFAFIPQGRDARDSTKLVMLTADEHLRLYSEKGARISQTDETYSGSVRGIVINRAMPGLGKDTVSIGDSFYIPMRILVTNLSGDGNYEIIVNRPISTASQIFSGYRSFPQSEIHALYWDGVGLNLLWKTRRIKGSMVDYAIADVNNDGIPDLVTCVNTHPGALGVSAQKAIVLFYPLDLSKTSPNASQDSSDFYGSDKP